MRKAHRQWRKLNSYHSGGDALGGNTRSHPEHDSVLARYVKTQAADGTMLETAWESRWLPD